MSSENRAQLLVKNDITIYRLVLVGLLIASPSLHYLCFNNSYDPLWLRGINFFLCTITLAVSYTGNYRLFKAIAYVTICAYLIVNNFVLLGNNGFGQLYIFSSITIFIALTLLCKKQWEFISISVLNTIAVLAAYYIAPALTIPPLTLVVLLIIFKFIAYVSFLVMTTYQKQFKKAVNNIIELNKSLTANAKKLSQSQQQLNSLISSIDDTIFEFDEDFRCLNVWFGPQTPSYLKREHFLNKYLHEAIEPEKARPFIELYSYVIQHQKPSSIEFKSVFGQPLWFCAKAAPVFDADGNYMNRISVSVSNITEQKKHADILKENESLLQQAHAIAKTGNWWYNADSKENYWSESLFNILEIDNIPDGLTKLDYYVSLAHPDERDTVLHYLHNFAAGSQNSLEHKIITPKGSLKFLKILKDNLPKNNGDNVKRLVAIIQDVTEARLREKAIKLSQTELIEAQAIAKIGNWKWRNSTKMLAWSDQVNAIYEFDEPTESFSGKLLIKYIHPEDRYVIKHLFNAASGTSIEYRIITPKGNLKHISVITGKLIYNDDGSIRKIVGTLQDITQRKQAEIEYRRTENKYQLVLETIKLAAVSLDVNGRVIFCNRYLANLLGYSPLEILGMDWLANFVPAEHGDILTNWFKNNTIHPHYINPVICRNGELRIISWQNTVSYDEAGSIKETTSIGEDITVQQQVRQELISAKEQAERSSHFKSEFLSVMSHEIRTPMNAVIGTTNLLLDENPKPEQLEYLNTLKFSSENLLAIINDILDYNKIEAGKLQLSNIPFNIHELVQNVRQSFYPRALEKNISIELETDLAIPAFLMGDSVRLGQILINLVSNGVKFTPEGKVSITVEKERQVSPAKVLVKFTVADTGIGIAAENLAIVFDPFIQEPQTVKHNFGGTGLGLAITKRLIELYQSNIQVTSHLGKGTTFTFSIQFAVAPEAAEQPKNTLKVQDATVDCNLAGMNILVVDDNRMNLMIASKFLKKWHAHVSEAANGQIAVDLTKEKNFDVIIMDLQMPVMDGFEATALIKKIKPGIPVIAFTADAMPDTYAKAFEAGMCDYLTKPFVPEVLYNKIAKYRPTFTIT